MQCRGRGPTALVLPARIGAHRGLVVGLDGQDAVADTQALQAQKLQRAGRIVADGVVMRRLAPDHTAEGDVAVEICQPRGHADGRRDFERAGDVDDLVAGPCRVDHRQSPRDLMVRDILVVGRRDDQQLWCRIELGQRQGVVRGAGHLSDLRYLARGDDLEPVGLKPDDAGSGGIGQQHDPAQAQR